MSALTKKKMIASAVLGATVLLSGCVPTNYNYRPESHEISEPAIGLTTTASVGDSLLRQGIFVEQDALYLGQAISVGSLVNVYTLAPGFYVKKGADSKSGFYVPLLSPDGGAIQKAALADPPELVRAMDDYSKICVVTVYHNESCASGKNFKLTKKSVATANSFQQTLIYSGKSGSKINVGYREVSDNFARPAFNNDVEYDLSESDVIGYKGASIRVIEATNDHITYKVLRNFNDAVR